MKMKKKKHIWEIIKMKRREINMTKKNQKKIRKFKRRRVRT